MKRITIILMLGTLMCGGCSLVNWDMNHQESTRKGPGAQAHGKLARVEYKADGSVVAEADKFVDQNGNEHPAEVEVRKDVNTYINAWTSDFDIFRMGSQKEMEVNTSINKTGEVNATSKQEPHGLTGLEWILVIAGVVVGPLLLGSVATAVGFPAIGSVLTTISPLSWGGKLLSSLTSTKTVAVAETEAETKETKNAD